MKISHQYGKATDHLALCGADGEGDDGTGRPCLACIETCRNMIQVCQAVLGNNFDINWATRTITPRKS